MKIEARSCPACGNVCEMFFVEKCGPYTILECTGCGLQHSDPMDYDFANYEQSYAGRSSPLAWPYKETLAEGLIRVKSGQVLKGLAPFRKKVIEFLRQSIPSGSPVLDIGCGSGVFLQALQESGFQPYGMDVASFPIDMLRDEGFNVTLNSLDNYPDSWPIPNAVTLLETLEHVPDPFHLLRAVVGKFPDANIYVTVPSPHRWVLRKGPDSSDYPPNHLTRWNERALSLILSRAGYRPTVLTPGVGGSELSTWLDQSISWILLRGGKKKAGPIDLPVRRENDIPVGVSHPRLKAIKSLLYGPLAWYHTRRGYRDHSMIGIGIPRTDGASIP